MDPQQKRCRAEQPLANASQQQQLQPALGTASAFAARSMRPWTSSEIAVMVDLVERELPLSDVAMGLGRTTAECKFELNRHRASTKSITPVSLRPSINSVASHEQRDLPSSARDAPHPSPPPSQRSTTAPKPWSLQDDLSLADAVSTHGPRWQTIKDTTFPDRSTSSISRRWAMIEGLMVTATASAHAAFDPTPQLQAVLGAWHDTSNTAVENRKVNAALRRRLATGFFSGSESGGSRSPESFGAVSDHSDASSISLSGLRIGSSSGSDRSSVEPSPAGTSTRMLAPNVALTKPLINTSHHVMDRQQADLTGDRLVEMVQQFVERHATMDSPPVDESAIRHGALNSIDNVMQHLDLYRPREQVGLVANEMAHSLAQSSSSHRQHPLLPDYVTSMQCEPDSESTLPELEAPSPSSDPFSRRQRVRPPGAEEVQAMVSMHIHRTLEEQSIGPGTSYGGLNYSPAYTGGNPYSVGGRHSPTPSDDDDRNYAATAARASAAVFFASWANLETAGALHSPSWSNVFEPQRCVLRGGMPRMMAFLPCLYVSLSGTSAGAPTPTCAGDVARNFASRLCPFRLPAFREWMHGEEASLAEHAAATPW